MSKDNSVLPYYESVTRGIDVAPVNLPQHQTQTVSRYYSVDELPERELRRKRWDQVITTPQYVAVGNDPEPVDSFVVKIAFSLFVAAVCGYALGRSHARA